MLRRPPRSTLFPYDALPILEQFLEPVVNFQNDPMAVRIIGSAPLSLPLPHLNFVGPAITGPRSEEHTSELQSHSDLVCRLLLEKKKIHKVQYYIVNTQEL